MVLHLHDPVALRLPRIWLGMRDADVESVEGRGIRVSYITEIGRIVVCSRRRHDGEVCAMSL